MQARKLITFTSVAILLSVGCLTVLAQSVRRIQFPPGQATTKVRGQIKGAADVTYLVRAVKGQTLRAHLTVGRDEYASLLIEGPGKIRLKNANGTDADSDFDVTIPRTGNYRIVVFPPDTADKTDVAHYSLEVTVK
jgi:hypothetical protein